MPFPFIAGVTLIPGSGEFAYDTLAYSGRQMGESDFSPINTFHAPGGSRTDLCYALDQLQASLPNCATVAIVVQWFANSLDAGACRIYPSSTYLGGALRPTNGSAETWRVSDVTLATPGVIPIRRDAAGQARYGGTPSDQSILRCIQELKGRGFKVALYPFLALDLPGKPWRATIGAASDVSAAAAAAVAQFLGNAAPADFTRDGATLTTHYAGPPTDFSYRRFILHYAHLAVLAGGVSVFALGSELLGLEAIRGPNWTPAGATDAAGQAIWDYPFVDGLIALANDVRAVFDAAGLTKDLAARRNLIVYSSDWTQWMGVQHTGRGYRGVWPHLDRLYASSAIDYVAFDNYAPLADWTTGDGGLDARNWRAPAPDVWPVAEPATIGLGLSGAPDIHEIAYLQANVEGGETSDWYYTNYDVAQTLDPNGSLQIVTAPQGDRLAQTRKAYAAGQELFAPKRIRWWWNNAHRAVYDAGDGLGTVPRGALTQWVPQSKSVGFLEYGFPTVDRGPNQNNKFFDPAAQGGGAPFWAVWNAAGSAPLIDNSIALLAHEAFYRHWTTNNMTSASGVAMIATDLMFAWTWDARPLPEFPLRTDIWADGVNWRFGHWLNGKLPVVEAPAASAAPVLGPFARFPTLPGLSFSAKVTPRFATDAHERASGKSGRSTKMREPLYEIELSFDLLRSGGAELELQQLLGFFKSVRGQALPFWFAPPELLKVTDQPIGVGDGVTRQFPLIRSIGGYTEPLAGVSTLAAVRIAGVTQPPAAYMVSSSYRPILGFTTPPESGATITIDAEALWLCRFAEDTLGVEQFAANFFEAQSVKLVTVKP